jgi:hypothetical protein
MAGRVTGLACAAVAKAAIAIVDRVEPVHLFAARAILNLRYLTGIVGA